jgi:hypothetical protein
MGIFSFENALQDEINLTLSGVPRMLFSIPRFSQEIVAAQLHIKRRGLVEATS